MSGKTVTPHTGVTAPINEAAIMVFSRLPLKTSAMWRLAPLALTHAAMSMPGITRGETLSRLIATNTRVSLAWIGKAIASATMSMSAMEIRIFVFEIVRARALSLAMEHPFLSCRQGSNLKEFKETNSFKFRYQ
ncbi:hypothetical protein [Pseudovibrio ascidiaceicola]|uniref:hypothetical protein n=1 Tax=Pseudovibrio ascidiaceicola TaxID=285279 RepID=UPI001AD83EC6|nr:hypothetical protein [Pseudovibrio ascidiaceicola]